MKGNSMPLSFSKLIKFFILIPLAIFCLFYIDKELHTPAPIPIHKKVDMAQVKCLATNIFFEAGSEPYLGQVAVARVVMNRVRHGFASSPCKVIYQSNYIEQGDSRVKRCQFSWVCEGKSKPNERDPRFKQAMDIAFKVLAYDAYKEVLPRSALFFHANYIEPNWPHRKIKQIGNHIFYARSYKKS